MLNVLGELFLHDTMKIEAIIESNLHHFLQGMRTEDEGYKEALLIVRKYLSGEKITDEDDKILKTQLMDSMKIIGIGIPFVLIPGASILMPIIIKVAEKHNIELLPSAFSNQDGQNN